MSIRARLTNHGDLSFVALRWTLYCAFVCFQAYIGFHHEPWRDEADAWLFARDGSFLHMFTSASYSGTPALWYLVVALLARTGFPYQSLEVLALLLGCTAAWLVLFRLKLPLGIATLALVGYHLGYEYSVIARNYGLGVVLFFLAISMDKKRDSASTRYGLILAFLANTGVHFLVMAGALFASWIFSNPLARMRAKGVVIGLSGIALSIVQVFPREGGQIAPDFFAGCTTQVVPLVLESMFGPPIWNELQENLSLLVIILVFLATLYKPRACVFFSISLVGFSYIFGCKYYSGTRHSGLVFMALLGCLSLLPSSSCASDLKPRNFFIERIRRGSVWATWALLAFAQLLSVDAAVLAYKKEIKLAFSASGEMGRYLANPQFDDIPIAAHMPPYTSAVLPYLKRTQFYYPGINAWGSYMLWDKAYKESFDVTNEQAFRRAQEHFATTSTSSSEFLFLTASPFAEAKMVGYQMIFRTHGRPIYSTEIYYLYAPISGLTLPR